MKLTFEGNLFWYNIYEVQVTEKEIVDEHLYPANGKPRKVPEPEELKRLVDERIRNRRKRINGF